MSSSDDVSSLSSPSFLSGLLAFEVGGGSIKFVGGWSFKFGFAPPFPLPLAPRALLVGKVRPLVP